jgi:hypothetical protein
MDRKLLRYVGDVCPLYKEGALPAYEATRWSAEASQDNERITYHKNGFTALICKNPLLTWHRSFTVDDKPIHEPSDSFIHVKEWVPSFENPLLRKEWRSFGVSRLHGIAEVPVEGKVDRDWGGHAKRHLKTFQKQTEVRLRLGQFEELREPYKKSHIKRAMKGSLWRLTERHVRDHPETIDVLIAETDRDGIVAGFVAGNCSEGSVSVYLFGFYLPEAKKSYPMTGLVAWWFERTRSKGLRYCNFGDMCGPTPLPLSDSQGYSIFKTHFGVRRIHLPKSHWQITFRKS